MYNDVLNLKIPDEANTICFADDIVIVVTARHLDEIELLSNEAVYIIKSWMKSCGLELAEHKTEAVLISRRRKRDIINIKIGNHIISTQQYLTYLGVVIDDRLNFKKHIENVSVKASNVGVALSKMMPNVGGPKQKKRRLISSVVKSTILYAAPIWAEALNVESVLKALNSVYRLCTLRVCSAYKTTSLDAACVIAGMIPIDILADEAKRVYRAKKSNPSDTYGIPKIERAASMQIWQRRWEESQNGRWTFRLIPNIDTWLNRKHGEVNYYLTQFLTGHGGYRTYLYKYKLDTAENCPLCTNRREDAEHVMFTCPRFENDRLITENCIGQRINAENIIEVMTTSKENWDSACRFIKKVHEELREEEINRKLLLQVEAETN